MRRKSYQSRQSIAHLFFLCCVKNEGRGDLMPQTYLRHSVTDLDAYLQIIGSVITDGSRDTGISALSMMAVVVRNFPPGDMRDAAEDILCSYIAEVKPSPEELDQIRRMRMGA
jgi:hypothetical protein